MKKIKDLEVPAPRKLVSYDVTAFFTSITVHDTVAVTREKQDTKLQGRCELSIDQIVVLFGILPEHHLFCLQWDILSNIQITGAPMDTPVSPSTVNAKMEDFEVNVLASLPNPCLVLVRRRHLHSSKSIL